MTTNAFCDNCIDDLCVDGAMPVGIDYANHCEKPNDEAITEIFYTSRNHPLTGDPSLAASWAPRLSNTVTTGFPIRSLRCHLAEKPVPTLNYKNNRAGTSATLSESERTINLVIDDDSDEMYELMRQLQCNGNVAFAYRSTPHIYGMKDGVGGGHFIEGVIKPAFGIVPGGTDLAKRWQVAITYTEKCEEPRIIAPI